MVHTGQGSYAYWMIEGTKLAADPSTDQNIPFNPMAALVPPEAKNVETEERTFNSLEPKIVYTGEIAPGEGPLEGSFRDPFLLLAYFTHKTLGGTWVTDIGTIDADFTAVDDVDTIGIQSRLFDQSGSGNHVDKLLKGGLPMKYSWIVEVAKLLKEVAEVKTLTFATNTQAPSIDNKFHDQSFGSGVGGWALWDKSGLGALPEISTVQCIAAASITTGWYFTYSSGHVDYYVWMDKNGDGSTDDPGPIGTRTGVACNISGATTADDVALIVKNALDALAITTATVVTDTITINNNANGAVEDTADVDTTFTFATTQQGVSSGKRSVTNMVLHWGAALLTALEIQTMDMSFEVGQETEQTTNSLGHTIYYRSIRNFMITLTGKLNDLTGITEYDQVYSDRTKQILRLYYDTTVGQEKYLQFTNAYISGESDKPPIPEAGKPSEVTLIIKGGEDTRASYSGKFQYAADPSAFITTSP